MIPFDPPHYIHGFSSAGYFVRHGTIVSLLIYMVQKIVLFLCGAFFQSPSFFVASLLLV